MFIFILNKNSVKCKNEHLAHRLNQNCTICILRLVACICVSLLAEQCKHYTKVTSIFLSDILKYAHSMDILYLWFTDE